MIMNKKAEFISAYVYMFGGTKKAAGKVYKTADEQYISAIIDGFKQNAKTGFYHD